MALIHLAAALIILSILYARMIRREKPEAIGKAQAVVPVVLGAISTPLSTALFLGIGYALLAIGLAPNQLPAFPHSIVGAFLMAGLPEELMKLVMMLVTLLIFRKKVKNVYEYILIGAAVGFGFTLLEEFLYASGSTLTAVGRVATIAAHMAFGIVMAKHLGLARYSKETGSGSVAGNYALALVIPIVVHTLLDAFTATNRMWDSSDDLTSLVGLVLGLLAYIAIFIWQIYMLVNLKKRTEKYCAMELTPRS